MLNLTKPRYVMPFHGDHKRLRLHAELAESVGIDPERHLHGPQRAAARDRRDGRPLRRATSTPGMIFVDGVDIGDPDDVALRDRRMLSADGIFIVVATVSVGRRLAGRRRPRSSSAACRSSRRPTACVDELRDVGRGLARTTAAEDEVREIDAAPAGPARRRRGVRLRAPAPPADGAAGRRRGLSRRLLPAAWRG